ncbi:bHLH transcription factor [Medicago truncatula]|uniref:BHLH transcription factor n=1 Tax=Medicago truncatula TaxID=3880 RepID=G7L5R3_MEDTR|nr:bHLH transcription factor [Medicago truncatula]
MIEGRSLELDSTTIFGLLKTTCVLAERSIQWSYAIFWSASANQPGVLRRWEGYNYNGDIKTRKTSQGGNY